MPRYKAVIAYDGTNYSGFQIQDNGNTVQAELEKTLKKFNNGQAVTVFASGRTDAGVHAEGQVIHFDFPQKRDEEKFRHALDTQSPADIAVCSVEEVAADFHARYDAVEKTYHYYVDLGKPRNPFRRQYAAYYTYPLDVSKMEQAIKDFEGTHDFSAFCATGTIIENKVRTIHEAKMEYVNEREIRFTFRGDGFLYKMVRIMVGTLLRIGQGLIDPTAIPGIIASGERDRAGLTAHPEGLYLMNVKYTEK